MSLRHISGMQNIAADMRFAAQELPLMQSIKAFFNRIRQEETLGFLQLANIPAGWRRSALGQDAGGAIRPGADPRGNRPVMAALRGQALGRGCWLRVVVRLRLRLGWASMAERVEIVSGVRRRREWSDEDKLRFVAETYGPETSSRVHACT